MHLRFSNVEAMHHSLAILFSALTFFIALSFFPVSANASVVLQQTSFSGGGAPFGGSLTWMGQYVGSGAQFIGKQLTAVSFRLFRSGGPTSYKGQLYECTTPERKDTCSLVAESGSITIPNFTAGIYKFVFNTPYIVDTTKYYIVAVNPGFSLSCCVIYSSGIGSNPLAGMSATTSANGWGGQDLNQQDLYFVLEGDAVDIATSTTWQHGKTYKISGNVQINSGVTVTVEPGAIVKFDTATSSSLIINGTLNAAGSTASTTFFTSIKDDIVGGDFNNDGVTTSPNFGDWGNITINTGGTATIGNAVVRYGGDSGIADGMIRNNGGSLNIATTTVSYSETTGIMNITGTTTVVASDISFNDYGLYLGGGNISVTATSTIHDNVDYGAFNATAATSSFFAQNNYWATATATAESGPYNLGSNPTGTANPVSDYISFDPWIGKLVTDLPHYVITDSAAIQPAACILPYTASTTYTAELNNAINTWNALPRIDIVAATSSSIWNLEINDEYRPDQVWRGLTSHGYVIVALPDQATSTILLNSYLLNGNSSNYIEKTIAHELGHALGLNHSFNGNIMYALAAPQTALGSQDELDYDYQWSTERDWTNVCP